MEYFKANYFIKVRYKKIMSILLVNPPRIISKGNIWKKIDRALPPLGLAFIASYLEKKKEKVFILDLQAENMSHAQFQSRLEELRPDFIGITSTTVEIEGALSIAKLSKGILPGAKIIFGGVHPSVMPDEVLSDDYVDFVVRGEGEFALSELISGMKNISNILNLSYKQDGKIIHNSFRPVIENLDEMPMPAYHLLPMKRYKPSVGNYKRLPSISMIATRGCPGRCTFCYTGISGKRTRTHSASYLLEQIKLLQKDFKIKEISFYDDTFTAFRENVREFCERIIKEKIDITWSCMSRIDFIDEEILRLMKHAGCHQIGYGLESANPEILRNIRKPMELDLARKVVIITKKSGIDVRAMFMLGNPGETEDTLKKTLRFAIEIDPDIAIFNITVPMPGTEMYEWAKGHGYLLKVPWSEFDLANTVMRLPTISTDKIKYYYHQAYKLFYMRPSYLFKRMLKTRSVIDIKNNIKSLCSMLAFEKEKENDRYFGRDGDCK